MLVMIVITMGLIGGAVGVRIDKCVCPGAWAAMFSHSSTSCFACTSDSFIAWHVMQTSKQHLIQLHLGVKLSARQCCSMRPVILLRLIGASTVTDTTRNLATSTASTDSSKARRKRTAHVNPTQIVCTVLA